MGILTLRGCHFSDEVPLWPFNRCQCGVRCPIKVECVVSENIVWTEFVLSHTYLVDVRQKEV